MIERKLILYHPGAAGSAVHKVDHSHVKDWEEMAIKAPSDKFYRSTLITRAKDLGNSARDTGLQGEDLFSHQEEAVAGFNKACQGAFEIYKIPILDIIPR